MMGPRQRVLAVLEGRTPDLVPWMGDLGVGFYLQADIPFRGDSPSVRLKEETQDGRIITEVITPVGSIRQVSVFLPQSFTWATVEHFVKSVADLKVVRYWFQGTTYAPAYAAVEERRLLVGDAGIVLSYLPKSPLMELVALLAGIETVTYASADAPGELEETIAIMEAKADEAALTAIRPPAECLMIPENLSSEVIGKSLFERFVRPYEEKWVARIREAGKYSFIHMDGTLRGLITEVASTGFDVLEALTPDPVGDMRLEEIVQRVPSSTIIWGGLPGVSFTDVIADGEFDAFVIRALEVMKRQPRYVLAVDVWPISLSSMDGIELVQNLLFPPPYSGPNIRAVSSEAPIYSIAASLPVRNGITSLDFIRIMSAGKATTVVPDCDELCSSITKVLQGCPVEAAARWTRPYSLGLTSYLRVTPALPFLSIFACRMSVTRDAPCLTTLIVPLFLLVVLVGQRWTCQARYPPAATEAARYGGRVGESAVGECVVWAVEPTEPRFGVRCLP